MPPASNPPADEVVLLLHGLGRSRISMWPLARCLRSAGWRVVNVGYPGLRAPLPLIADTILAPLLSGHPVLRAARRIHVVTHSMGGILLRQFLVNHDFPKLGRVVMLAPPNRGSEVADWLRHWPAWWCLGGPNRRLLGTRDSDLPAQLPTARPGWGILAAARPRALPFGPWMPGDNDGLVAVARTHLAGEADFREVRSAHMFVMWNRAVHRHVLHFLAAGRFADDTRR